MISYDDFTKLDIRIGKVISAERIPDTDKLLRLMVDVGEEKERQIVSGIALFVTPESLVDKEFPFIVNLEPRMIRGVESQGMILAVGDGEIFSLMSPLHEVKPGARIK